MDFNVFDSTTQVKIDVVFCNNDTACINEKTQVGHKSRGEKRLYNGIMYVNF